MIIKKSFLTLAFFIFAVSFLFPSGSTAATVSDVIVTFDNETYSGGRFETLATVVFNKPELYNESVKFSYHIYDLSGNLVRWEGIRKPFVLDGHEGKVVLSIDRAVLDLPKDMLEFIVKPDLVDEKNVFWFGDNPEIVSSFPSITVRFESPGVLALGAKELLREGVEASFGNAEPNASGKVMSIAAYAVENQKFQILLNFLAVALFIAAFILYIKKEKTEKHSSTEDYVFSQKASEPLNIPSGEEKREIFPREKTLFGRIADFFYGPVYERLDVIEKETRSGRKELNEMSAKLEESGLTHISKLDNIMARLEALEYVAVHNFDHIKNVQETVLKAVSVSGERADETLSTLKAMNNIIVSNFGQVSNVQAAVEKFKSRVTIVFNKPELYNEYVKFSYHIYDLSGNLLRWEGIRKPFDFDGHEGKVTLDIDRAALDLPANVLEFVVKPDLVDEKNVFWFGDNPKITSSFPSITVRLESPEASVPEAKGLLTEWAETVPDVAITFNNKTYSEDKSQAAIVFNRSELYNEFVKFSYDELNNIVGKLKALEYVVLHNFDYVKGLCLTSSGEMARLKKDVRIEAERVTASVFMDSLGIRPWNDPKYPSTRRRIYESVLKSFDIEEEFNYFEQVPFEFLKEICGTKAPRVVYGLWAREAAEVVGAEIAMKPFWGPDFQRSPETGLCPVSLLPEFMGDNATLVVTNSYITDILCATDGILEAVRDRLTQSIVLCASYDVKPFESMWVNFGGREVSEKAWKKWAVNFKEDSCLIIYNNSRSETRGVLRFTIFSVQKKASVIVETAAGSVIFDDCTNAAEAVVPCELKPGANEIRFRFEGSEDAVAEDWRELKFSVTNPVLEIEDHEKIVTANLLDREKDNTAYLDDFMRQRLHTAGFYTVEARICAKGGLYVRDLRTTCFGVQGACDIGEPSYEIIYKAASELYLDKIPVVYAAFRKDSPRG